MGGRNYENEREGREIEEGSKELKEVGFLIAFRQRPFSSYRIFDISRHECLAGDHSKNLFVLHKEFLVIASLVVDSAGGYIALLTR